MKTNLKSILYLRTDIYDKELIAGGSVTHTVGVINGFIRMGYAVTVASSCMHKALKELAIEQLIELKNPHFLSCMRWKLNCLISNIFFTIRVYRTINFSGIECMYQRYGILNCVGILLKKMTHTKLILEYNGSEYWVNKHWGKRRFFNLDWCIKKIEMINLRYADTIVVVSDVLKDELISRGISPAKITMIPNGVDTDLYDPAVLNNDRIAIRLQLGLKNEDMLVGFIGTFGPWHGVELLADTIPEILREYTHAYFLLIGDGSLAPFMKNKINSLSNDFQKRIFFTGQLPSAQARIYLAACDIFVCPTQPNKDGTSFFGSPTKLFEYMSLGKPVIASSIGQIKDIIQTGFSISDESISSVNGVLFDPTNKNEFVAALRLVLDLLPMQRDMMGAAARRSILDNFSWDMHTRKIIDKVTSINRTTS